MRKQRITGIVIIIIIVLAILGINNRSIFYFNKEKGIYAKCVNKKLLAL